MALKDFRFKGGVKIPFLPELLYPSPMTVVMNFVPTTLSINAPIVYWRTNLTEPAVIQPGVPLDITLAEGVSELELYVEYSALSSTAFVPSASGAFKGVAEFTLTTPENNPVFPNFGTRVYRVTLQRVNSRPNNVITFFASGKDTISATHYRHFTRCLFSAGACLREMRMRLLDLNGNPLSAGLSEQALRDREWSDNTQAGWPAYSGTSNAPGSALSGTSSGTNFVITAGPTNNGPYTPVVWDGEWFIVPRGTAELQLNRSYLKASANNALLAAQASKSTVTKLRDVFIVEAYDAGRSGAAFIGRDNRFAPQSLITTDIDTSP